MKLNKKDKVEMGENMKVESINDLFFSKRIESETFIFCNKNRLRNTTDVTEFLSKNNPEEIQCSEQIKADLSLICNPACASSKAAKKRSKTAAVKVKKENNKVEISAELSSLKLVLFQQKNKFSAQALEVCSIYGLHTVGDLVKKYNSDTEMDSFTDTTRSVKLQVKEFLTRLHTQPHIFAQDVSTEELPKPTVKKTAAAKKAVVKKTVVIKESSSPIEENEEPKKAETKAGKKISKLDETPTTIIQQVSSDEVDFENIGVNNLSLFVKLNKLNSQIFQCCTLARVKTVDDFLKLKESDPQMKKLGVRLPKMKKELKKFIEYIENPVKEKEAAPETKVEKGEFEIDEAGKPKNATIEALKKTNVISPELYKFLSANSLDRLNYVVAYSSEFKSFDHLIGYKPEVGEELNTLMEKYKKCMSK